MSVNASASATILVVEDEGALRKLMRKMLEKQGFEVVEAASPIEALEISSQQSESIDLVVTDLMMPQMSGRELADRLAKSHPQLQVLFMSGYAWDDIVRQGLLPPGMPFLSKPFNLARLEDAIRELLDPKFNESGV